MLRIIGQMEQMKMVQVEAGSAALKTIRPIGSQASGDTGRRMLMIGSSMLFMKAKRPMTKPRGRPTRAATPKPMATRALPQGRQDVQPMPWSFGPFE